MKQLLVYHELFPANYRQLFDKILCIIHSYRQLIGNIGYVSAITSVNEKFTGAYTGNVVMEYCISNLGPGSQRSMYAI